MSNSNQPETGAFASFADFYPHYLGEHANPRHKWSIFNCFDM